MIAKADGTFVPRERRKRHEEKGKNSPPPPSFLFCFHLQMFVLSAWTVITLSLVRKTFLSNYVINAYLYCILLSSLCTKTLSDAWDLMVFNLGIPTDQKKKKKSGKPTILES